MHHVLTSPLTADDNNRDVRLSSAAPPSPALAAGGRQRCPISTDPRTVRSSRVGQHFQLFLAGLITAVFRRPVEIIVSLYTSIMSRPYIIQVGLPWDHHSIPAEIQDMVRQRLDDGYGLFEAAGYDFDQSFCTPEEGPGPLLEAIQKRVPAVIVIGNGVRSNMALTPFLEQIIDAIRTHAPETKIGFNTRPDDGVEAAKRWIK